MLDAARRAWACAGASGAVYRQPADVHTGGYDDALLDDEFAWAATELYLGTAGDVFYDAVMARKMPASVPNWAAVGGLAWMSLVQHRARLTAHADQARIARGIDGVAARLARTWRDSAWPVAMAPAISIGAATAPR